MPDPKINQKFGNRVRLRVCGLCWLDEQLLMVNHRGLSEGAFWSPPGGGVEFGEDVHSSLKKEFMEETGLVVSPGRLLFTCEFIKGHLHAIELFFEAIYVRGEIRIGSDPELGKSEQLITDVRFLGFDEIARIPTDEKHGIFRLADDRKKLENLNGFYRI